MPSLRRLQNNCGARHLETFPIFQRHLTKLPPFAEKSLAPVRILAISGPAEMLVRRCHKGVGSIEGRDVAEFSAANLQRPAPAVHHQTRSDSNIEVDYVGSGWRFRPLDLFALATWPPSAEPHCESCGRGPADRSIYRADQRRRADVAGAWDGRSLV